LIRRELDPIRLSHHFSCSFPVSIFPLQASFSNFNVIQLRQTSFSFGSMTAVHHTGERKLSSKLSRALPYVLLSPKPIKSKARRHCMGVRQKGDRLIYRWSEDTAGLGYRYKPSVGSVNTAGLRSKSSSSRHSMLI
jgi:hypothetical protein